MRLISSAGMNLSRFPLIANLDVSVSNKHSWLDGPIAGAEGSVAGHPFTRARKNKYTTRPNETGIRNATPLKNCPSTNCDPLLKNVHQVRTGGRARSHCIQDIIQPSEKKLGRWLCCYSNPEMLGVCVFLFLPVPKSQNKHSKR